jgi:exoribonuclease R
VPHVPLRLAVDDPDVVSGLALIREQQRVPGPHPGEVVAAAEGAAAAVLGSLDDGARRDARGLAFVTIDPEGSRDLDQALHVRRRGSGWRVHYAIADVGAFVEPASSLDATCWDRGLTFYLPDGRAPLHPDVLGEGSASLLPGQDRPAVLWTVDLDGEGAVVTGSDRVERAVVRSRAQLTYADAQAAIGGGAAGPDDTLSLLREVGEARQRQEVARGGVSLDLPSQRVEAVDGGYRIEFETTLPSMGWNAQISLLVGIVAAARMLAAGIGLLRTMPPPPQHVVAMVRRTARALEVDWPEGVSYAEVVRGLDSDDPDQAALLALAARGLRGAGYLALPGDDDGSRGPGGADNDGGAGAAGGAGGAGGADDDDRPRGPGDPGGPGGVRGAGAVPAGLDDPRVVEHAAVAAPYAHVTAPLRRLGDRYATEVCLALEAGSAPPAWAAEGLVDLPPALQKAGGRESGANRAAVDLVEALVLRPMVGRDLEVAVVSSDDDGSTVVCRDPAIEVRIPDHRLPLGDQVTVRIAAADPATRKVTLEPR